MVVFNQTWRIILRGRGFKVVQFVCVAHVGPGGGPQRANILSFQTSSSPDPEGEWSSYVVCRYLIRWRIKVFMAVPRVAPIGPCGPFVKSNCFIFFLKMHGILTKHARIILRFKVVYGSWTPMGGGGGPNVRAPMPLQISNFLSRC